MANWLFKEEPETYSYDDLENDGSTWWSGVNNALAKKHLREVKPGDRIFFYATGKVKAIIGEMTCVTAAEADPDSEESDAIRLKVKPVKRLKRAVTLKELKADATFAEWELVRLPRLSVMPVPAALWAKIEKMG